MRPPFDGILLVDKPVGWSSFKVVAVVRRRLSEVAGKKVKVGHAGTLDPFATGLLIILVGAACKQANRFLKLDKTYEVTAVLGSTSSTGDPEGELTSISSVRPAAVDVRAAVQSFQGAILQTPPIFSAIKINGVRAYALARKGQEVALQPRPVHIYSIDELQYAYPHFSFTCHVASGTYIRSLVVDIGEKLGTGAYCQDLRRTTIGDFSVEHAIEPDQVTPTSLLAIEKGEE